MNRLWFLKIATIGVIFILNAAKFRSTATAVA